MQNKKVPSMVAVGASLLIIGYMGARQIDSVGSGTKNTEKSNVTAEYGKEIQTGLFYEKKEQNIVAMAMPEQMLKDAKSVQEPQTSPEAETESEPETQSETETSTEPETQPETEAPTEPETQPEPETEPEVKSEFSIALWQISFFQPL